MHILWLVVRLSEPVQTERLTAIRARSPPELSLILTLLTSLAIATHSDGLPAKAPKAVGMSKTRLAALLAEHGIAYEHRRRLGTPPDLRALYRAGRVAEAAAAYRVQLEDTAADELSDLARELESGPATALLCLEADPAECHRSVVADALRRRSPALLVVDL